MTMLRAGSRYVTRWLLTTPTTSCGPSSCSGPSANTQRSTASDVASDASAERIVDWSACTSASPSRVAIVIVSYGGVRSTTGKRSARPPASTAHRCTSSRANSERTAARSQRTAPIATVPQSPGIGPATGSSTVRRASMRRTPSTNAMRAHPSSWPSSGAQSTPSTPSSTVPSAGASSAASSGAPYSGDQPSTKMRAIPAGYYAWPPTPPDRRASGGGRPLARRLPGAAVVDQQDRAHLAGTAMGVAGPVDRLAHNEPGRIGARVDRAVAAGRAIDDRARREVDDRRRAAGAGAAGLGEDHRVVRPIARHIGDLGAEVLDRCATGGVRASPDRPPGRTLVLEPPPGGDASIGPEGVAARQLPGNEDHVTCCRRGAP